MREVGDVYDIAQGVVYLAADTGKFITGEVLVIDGGNSQWGDVWPGGKPDYAKRPGDQPHQHDSIFPKRILIFSPHPDDDVIPAPR